MLMSVPSFHFPDNDTPQQTDDFSIDPALILEFVCQKSVSVAVPSQSITTAIPEAEGTLFSISALSMCVQSLLFLPSPTFPIERTCQQTIKNLKKPR